MARQDQIARVLAVASALARSRRGVALRQLADRNGWNIRTLYRDIKAIEKAGLPIVKQDNRYRLMAGAHVPGGVDVDTEELLALFVARKLAAGYAGTRMARALDRLWAKLSTRSGQPALLPESAALLEARPPSSIDYGAHRATIQTIERAIDSRQVIRARYRALSTGDETSRDLEPGQLHWDPGTESLYLIAYCRLRRAIRVFAVHRFRAVTLQDERFGPRADAGDRALASAFRLWRRETIQRVRVRFTGRAAVEIRERRWHSSQQLSEEPDGAVVLAMEIAAPAELVRWLAGFGAGATVLEPRELADALVDLHAGAAKRGRARRAESLTPGDNSRGETRRTRKKRR